ncbi:MAG: tetratricopeptide repeat protein, partial [Gemmatimonadota bacterium]
MTSLRRTLLVTLVFLAASRTAAAQNPADAAWASGDFNTARQLYSERLAADSSDIRALHRLALLFAWDEQYDESLLLFDRLLMVAPENLDARIDRARVISWTGDFDKSIESYEEALERHPGDRQVLLGMAQVLSWADRLDSALTIYDGLVAKDSTDFQARHGLARAAAWRGNLVEAERLWRETLAQDENNAETLLGLSQTLRWQGRADAAREVLAQVPIEARMTSGYIEEERWIGVALGTRLSPSLAFEFDSDDNTMVTLSVRGASQMRPRLQLGFDTYYRYANWDVSWLDSRRAWGFAATGQMLFEP